MIATGTAATTSFSARRKLPMPARGGVKYRSTCGANIGDQNSAGGYDKDDNPVPSSSTSFDSTPLSGSGIHIIRQNQSQNPIHPSTSGSSVSAPSRAAAPMVSPAHGGSAHARIPTSWEPPAIRYHQQSLTLSRAPHKASVAPAPVMMTPSFTTDRSKAMGSPTANSSDVGVGRSYDNSQHPLRPDPSRTEGSPSEEAWRRYGRLFRANLVLDDERNGGNSFSLSDSCTIERYYRVADRVLQQFLSSNIAERNEMIESYLVGNRLFKFLSVVLPTHGEYFSGDPTLAALRSRSQSQLIVLLEYMEELELMIDEMEYNKYILKDLTPSGGRGAVAIDIKNTSTFLGDDAMNTSNNTTMTSICEESFSSWDMVSFSVEAPLPNSSNVSSSRDNNHNQKGGRTRTRTPTIQGLAQVASFGGGSSQNRFDTSGSVSTAGQETAESSSHRIRSSSRRSHRTSSVSASTEDLEQRVAAVLAARSLLDNSTDTNNSMSVSRSSASFNHEVFQHSEPHDHQQRVERGRSTTDSRRHQSWSAYNQKSSQPMKEGTERSWTHDTNEQQVQHESIRSKEELVEATFGTWDVDFEKFDSSFPDTQGEDVSSSVVFSPSSRIDLLLHEDATLPCTNQQKQEQQQTSPKPLPKLKQPPTSYPRSVRAEAQVQASRYSSAMHPTEVDTSKESDDVESTENLSHPSDASNSDIFHSLEEDSSPPKLGSGHGGNRMASIPTVPKTKIEQRLERASMKLKSNASSMYRNPNKGISDQHYEESSLVEHLSQRKLLHQFRGCVRCLLE